MAEHQVKIGDTLPPGRLATYRIVSVLGGGKSSETYLAAVENPTDRLRFVQNVVVKVPKLDSRITEAGAKDRLDKLDALIRAEEICLQRLHGLPSVAQHLDSGSFFLRLSTGREIRTTFITQQYVEGKNLDKYMQEKYPNFKGIPTAKDFFLWAEKLAKALRQIHSQVVVHGDIWPENILVNGSDEPIFIDFGQALLREVVSAPIDVSGRNAKYVAPEQAKSVEGDVYSLGGVLFNLATGQDPPSGIEHIEKLKEEIAGGIRSNNPELYRSNCGIADVIARCLRYSRHGRTPHAELVLQELEAFGGPPQKPNTTNDMKEFQAATSDLDKAGNPLFSLDS